MKLLMILPRRHCCIRVNVNRINKILLIYMPHRRGEKCKDKATACTFLFLVDDVELAWSYFYHDFIKSHKVNGTLLGLVPYLMHQKSRI